MVEGRGPVEVAAEDVTFSVIALPESRIIGKGKALR